MAIETGEGGARRLSSLCGRLAQAKAQEAPRFLTQLAALAWERRWTRSVRVVFCRVIGGTNVARVVVRDRRGPTNNCGRPFSRRSVVILCADIFPILSAKKKRKCHWTKVFLDEFFFFAIWMKVYLTWHGGRDLLRPSRTQANLFFYLGQSLFRPGLSTI